MYSNLLNQLENAFYESHYDNSFSKHGKGYVGPLKIKEEDSHCLIEKVIVGFCSSEITANVRKSILKVFLNNEKEKPTDVVSLRIDPDYLDASKISSNLKNGILTIKIPKLEKSQTVQIPIE